MIGFLPAPRIVETWSGRNTGDTCYRTDDGLTWKTYHCGPIGTGDGPIHLVVNGCMVPKPSPAAPPLATERRPNRAERRASRSPRKRKWKRADDAG